MSAATQADAALVQWLAQAQSTSGNVTADNSGWTLTGSAGFTYDYGVLDGIGGAPVDGSTIEYIFNLSDAGPSVAIGSATGWSPGNERNVYKLEQWNNTGKFGVTIQGIADYSLATDSTFNQDVHVVFRRNNDGGTLDLFINGAFVETHGAKTNWRQDGGLGTIGANWNNNADFATGEVFGVASYDTALSNTDISNLYAAYSAAPIPEPSSTALLGLAGMGLLLRRRK